MKKSNSMLSHERRPPVFNFSQEEQKMNQISPNFSAVLFVHNRLACRGGGQQNIVTVFFDGTLSFHTSRALAIHRVNHLLINLVAIISMNSLKNPVTDHIVTWHKSGGECGGAIFHRPPGRVKRIKRGQDGALRRHVRKQGRREVSRFSPGALPCRAG